MKLTTERRMALFEIMRITKTQRIETNAMLAILLARDSMRERCQQPSRRRGFSSSNQCQPVVNCMSRIMHQHHLPSSFP